MKMVRGTKAWHSLPGFAKPAAAAGLLCLGLTGCAITPPVTRTAAMCGFKMLPLEVQEPSPGVTASFEDAIADSLRIERPDNALLYLSGGSQNGAFGAGFLDQWARNGGRLPRFQAVTGISTGAILATWAFLGRPEVPAEAYAIDHERTLLTPYVTMKGGDITYPSYVSLLRKGAMADLGPLRRQLHARITPELLREVHAQSDKRQLLIGVVDMDSGTALALDMLDMAGKFVAAETQGSAAEADRYRDCYVEAIVASSSAPMAAKPVFIDNRMYADGGMAFGVFGAALQKALKLDAASNAAKATPLGGGAPSQAPFPQAPALYILVNGDQEPPRKCGKADKSLCGSGKQDPYWNHDGAHKKWTFTGLAMQTKNLLVTQVYRFSVADIVQRYELAYPPASRRLHFAKIEREPAENHAFNGKTCQQWEELDEKTLRPVQFYPNYMKCLISYGRARADALKWHHSDPKERRNDTPL